MARGRAMSLAAEDKGTADRSDMIREAFRLEYVTLAWMSLEAVVAIGSGLAAQGLVLVAFGLDSLIELASALGSRALRTDAVESITCGWVAFVVVAALAAQFATGLWWIDPVASLGIVWFLVREGREAWSGDECCHDH